MKKLIILIILIFFYYSCNDSQNSDLKKIVKDKHVNDKANEQSNLKTITNEKKMNWDRYIVTASNLIIRGKPESKATKLGIIPKNTEVLLIEKTNVIESINEKKAAWFKIRCFDGKEGFVFSGFLKQKKDTKTDNPKNKQINAFEPKANNSSDSVLIINKIKYNIRKIITHPKLNHFKVILLTNKNYDDIEHYGDSIIIQRSKSKKILYQSRNTLDSSINHSSIKIIDLNGDSIFEIVYEIWGSDDTDNDSIFNIVYQKAEKYHNDFSITGDGFQIIDINNDKIPEIIHSYNKPYYLQSGENPYAVYFDEIFVFRQYKLIKINHFCQYKSYLIKRRKLYDYILEPSNKNSFTKYLEFGNEKKYFQLAQKYKNMTVKRLRNCP